MDPTNSRGSRLLLSLFLVALLVDFAAAGPAHKRVPNSRVDQLNLAKLSDALSVARSPFEPVTLSASFSDAARLDATTEYEPKRLTTRAAAEPTQPETSKPEAEAQPTTLPPADETTTPAPVTETGATTENDEPETTTSAPTTTILPSTSQSQPTPSSKVEQPESTTTEVPSATTSAPLAASQATTASSSTSTTQPPATSETSTETASEMSNENTEATTEPTTPSQPDVSSSSTVAAEIGNFSATTPATGNAESQTTTASPVSNTEKLDENTSEPPTTSAPETSSAAAETEQPASPTPLLEPERGSSGESTTTETSSASTTEPSQSQPSSTERPSPAEQPILTTVEPVSSTTSTPEPPPTTVATVAPEAPTTSTATTTTEAPAVSSTTTKPESESGTSNPKEQEPATSSKPAASQPERSEPDAEKQQPTTGCNHLPTYEPDEIQKVFREETTYKNGTIKGKFTYINFDQRYRLVHYTRLPYGPIKIDFVDDLGRPDQKNPDAGAPNRTTTDDTPDSVLQLRNILPNSLFGFPFLNPSYKQTESQQPGASQQDSASRGNPFYYSTDSIATPNNPSSGVVTPANRRRLDGGADQRTYGLVGGDSRMNAASYNDGSLQMQYNVASQAYDTLLPGLYNNDGYSAFAQSQPNHHFASHINHNNHHQLHQMGPLIPLAQSPYFPPLTEPFQPNLAFAKPVFEYHTNGQLHRTYSRPLGPFMFLENSGRAAESSSLESTPHVKLTRVKTSRNLGAGSGIKSAQMRSAPSDSQQASHPLASPVQSFRVQRQRSGKQSSELRNPVNSRPIVYHVLTNRVAHSQSQAAAPRGGHDFSLAYDSEQQH